MNTDNKMGIVPVKKLLFSMGIPMILCMVLQAFYNIVDTFFVSNIEGLGDAATNALSLAFPVQMLMIAIGVGTGVGINSILSKSLGAGEREKASLIAGNAVFLGFCTYLVFLLFGLFGVDWYVASQTDDPVVTELAVKYVRICTILSFGSILSMIYEKLLQSTGKTALSTIMQLAGAIANIVLDPLLIFGLCGLPALGVAGAAWATVIGQILTFFLGILFHHAKNKEIDASFRYLLPKGNIIAAIYRVGFPAILMQALMSFLVYGVNILFYARLGADSVTAYGTYYKIQQFVFFAAFGLNNALIPLVAFNFGKQERVRVKESIRYGVLFTMALMAIGTALAEALAFPLSNLFGISEDAKALTRLALRIISVGYVFAGINIAFQGIFQALGFGVRSLLLSLLRLIAFPLPLAFCLTFAESASSLVWIAFPVAEALSTIFAFLSYRGLQRKIPLLKNRAQN
ncbi:MAG: MATE family efflux transporter [Clostridia bacterium]|nr:MATE family efflux transporter [Clostridia bacterium]